MNMNGCTFGLNSFKFVKKGEYNTLFDLECPAGKQVVIEMHSGAPVIHNELEMAKLKYTLTSSGCPVKAGTYEDLTYLGDNALKATKGGTQVG